MRLVCASALAALLAFGAPILAQTDAEPEAPAAEAPAGTAEETAPEAAPGPETAEEAAGEAPVPGTPEDEAGADAPDGAADVAAPDDDDPRAALEAVERSLSLTRERVEELRAEIAEIEGDRTRQNAALIAAAQRVRNAEADIAAVEDRLDELIIEEIQVRGRLDGADAEIANALGALARISRNPPPAIIVDPSDALGSARSAMLVSAILPQLTARADAVGADLASLTRIKEQVLEEEERLRANFAVLEEEQLRIATLVYARRQGAAVMSAELEAEEREALELAERAATLKDLIEGLNQRMTTVTAAAEAADADAEADPPVTPEEIAVALADTARTQPAIPFAAARGYLSVPAAGVTVTQFGANDGMGGIAQGLSIVTRAEAQVVAPADGWVLYKGPYLNYGQIVILNTGQNYTALLAGLEQISVDIGQFVLMGEPVGTMGSRTIGLSLTTNAGNTQPTLYIELRRDNEPFDPTDWWASEAQST